MVDRVRPTASRPRTLPWTESSNRSQTCRVSLAARAHRKNPSKISISHRMSVLPSKSAKKSVAAIQSRKRKRV